jgi:hypothetical protein
LYLHIKYRGMVLVMAFQDNQISLQGNLNLGYLVN